METRIISARRSTISCHLVTISDGTCRAVTGMFIPPSVNRPFSTSNPLREEGGGRGVRLRRAEEMAPALLRGRPLPKWLSLLVAVEHVNRIL
jgi:hypothetical protein